MIRPYCYGFNVVLEEKISNGKILTCIVRNIQIGLPEEIYVRIHISTEKEKCDKDVELYSILRLNRHNQIITLNSHYFSRIVNDLYEAGESSFLLPANLTESELSEVSFHLLYLRGLYFKE